MLAQLIYLGLQSDIKGKIMFYSKTTNGFYTTEIHGTNMPSDVVSITAEQWQALLQGQAEGQIITADANGNPINADQPVIPAPAPTAEQLAQAANKTAAITKLTALGLTADEISALGI
jgi:hypothetical protein